ncbi:hypothetical protein B5G16_11665 [Alistipes sp. An66]|nr:hypothetical protein B5G16_11665 [Alistipes sp. An66]
MREITARIAAARAIITIRAQAGNALSQSSSFFRFSTFSRFYGLRFNQRGAVDRRNRGHRSSLHFSFKAKTNNQILCTFSGALDFNAIRQADNNFSLHNQKILNR